MRWGRGGGISPGRPMRGRVTARDLRFNHAIEFDGGGACVRAHLARSEGGADGLGALDAQLGLLEIDLAQRRQRARLEHRRKLEGLRWRWRRAVVRRGMARRAGGSTCTYARHAQGVWEAMQMRERECDAAGGVACLRRRQLVERDDRQLVARAGHEPREERRRPARDLVDEELLELGQRARADGVGERAQVGDGVGREREALEPAEGAALGGERAERRDVVDLVRAKVELLWVAGGADPRGDCRGG